VKIFGSSSKEFSLLSDCRLMRSSSSKNLEGFALLPSILHEIRLLLSASSFLLEELRISRQPLKRENSFEELAHNL